MVWNLCQFNLKFYHKKSGLFNHNFIVQLVCDSYVCNRLSSIKLNICTDRNKSIQGNGYSENTRQTQFQSKQMPQGIMEMF